MYIADTPRKHVNNLAQYKQYNVILSDSEGSNVIVIPYSIRDLDSCFHRNDKHYSLFPLGSPHPSGLRM